MKLALPGQTLEKCKNKEFNKNASSGSRVVLCRRTDVHEKANSSFFAVV
jgi:hypothetical protein